MIKCFALKPLNGTKIEAFLSYFDKDDEVLSHKNGESYWW